MHEFSSPSEVNVGCNCNCNANSVTDGPAGIALEMRVWLMYCLSDMQCHQVAYITVHFQPDLHIKRFFILFCLPQFSIPQIYTNRLSGVYINRL
jgi:hypothetical protein